MLAEPQRRTALQSNYGDILLALVHGKPIQFTLRPSAPTANYCGNGPSMGSPAMAAC